MEITWFCLSHGLVFVSKAPEKEKYSLSLSASRLHQQPTMFPFVFPFS
jgi:hypothetical protein